MKWVTNVAALGATGTLVTAVLTSQGLVGGITSAGQVMFFDRDDGSLAVPLLNLPGGSGPPSVPAPAGLWEGGLLDPAAVQPVWDGFFGRVCEVCNTPAVHPGTGRIYIAAASATPADGVLYGIDLVSGEWQIAFETPTGARSGTSPAISPDGAQVYVADGDGTMRAVDAATGAVLWSTTGTAAAASPGVGPDGIVYSGDSRAAATFALAALNPADGSVKWQQNYDALAVEALPTLAPAAPFFPTGQPIARVNSVVSISAQKLWVALVLGYEFFNPNTGDSTAQAHSTVLAAVDPADGTIISTMPMRDTSEGIVVIDSDGSLYAGHAALVSSIFFHGVNPILDTFGVPPEYHVPGPPRAGISALEPVSFLAHVTDGLDWSTSLAADALAELPGGDTEGALVTVRRGRVQLAPTASSIATPKTRGSSLRSRPAPPGRARRPRKPCWRTRSRC